METFIKNVAIMRQMQNAYFKSKEQCFLIASKLAEKKVDDFLHEKGFLTGHVAKVEKNEDQQPTLF